MKIHHLFIAMTFFFSSFAFAQEYGASLGVHQTTADASNTTGSVDGKFNFKLGLAVNFELTGNSKFRTGALYNQRHMDYTVLGNGIELNFSYLDFPANFQYNFNPMIGLFGGLVVAAKVSDDVKTPVGVSYSPNADSLLPLLDVGVNLLFEDMIGFDFYYERGLGKIAEGVENYSTFGANFIYWY